MAKISPELIRIAARQVRVWRGGGGPNLVLLHGGLGDARWHWHTVWEELGETFSVAAPDLPRYGSTVELPRTSFVDLMEWLAQVQELLGMQQAAFVGNSFGAALARVYAAALPKRVTRLVLVDGGQLPRSPGIARKLLRSSVFAPLVDMTSSEPFSETQIRRAFGNQDAVTPDVITEAQGVSQSFQRLMKDVNANPLPLKQTPTVPTMLVWGEKDRIAPVGRAQEVAAAVDATELAVIKNAGHMPQLEDPLSFVKIVRDFCLPDPNS
jgi:pimeloyl-ACP methyl ester carboxylesterase